MERKEKQPSERYDYLIVGKEYFDELEDEDEISTVVFSKDTTTEPDLELDEPVYVVVGGLKRDFKVWISGGLDKTTYKITCLITTVIGRIEEFEFKLKVKET